MRKQLSILRKQYVSLLAEFTEIRKQSSFLRKQYVFLLAESTEMRKQSSILRKQYVFLLAKSTEIRKQSSILRKQYAFLLIRHLLKLIMRSPKSLVGKIHELCRRRFWRRYCYLRIISGNYLNIRCY